MLFQTNPDGKLAQLTAPHFCAGIVLTANGYVLEAAPILAYMKGWPYYQVAEYATRKRWKIQLSK